MRTLFTAALVASAFASPVLAQDRAPFTGARVEAVTGFDRVQSSGDHSDGIAYGGQLGYDFQSGLGLVGVEAEATGSTADECTGGATVANPTLCVKAGRDLYAGGRIGTVVSGSTLLYAKGGYTNARVRATSFNGTSTTTLAGNNRDGYRVGAGLEHSFGTNLYAKAEYRYSDYGDHIQRHQALAGVGVRF